MRVAPYENEFKLYNSISVVGSKNEEVVEDNDDPWFEVGEDSSDNGL